MHIEDLVVPNSYFKLKDNYLDLPEEIKQIRIDVGLCAEAVNSALWLTETDDRFVIGIEPLPYHWTVLQNFDTAYTPRDYCSVPFIQLEKNAVEHNNTTIKPINNRFCGVMAGIDVVNGIGERDFYEVIPDETRSGASSFLKLAEHHPQGKNIKDVIKVNTISLESILDLINWDRFPYIEHIKTDCEGYDPVVVQSIGKYLDKIVYISCEVTGRLYEHENAVDPNIFVAFMMNNGFRLAYHRFGEAQFVNTRLEYLVLQDNLCCSTRGT